MSGGSLFKEKNPRTMGVILLEYGPRKTRYTMYKNINHKFSLYFSQDWKTKKGYGLTFKSYYTLNDFINTVSF